MAVDKNLVESPISRQKAAKKGGQQVLPTGRSTAPELTDLCLALLLFLPALGIDEYINTSRLTYYIKELNLLVVIIAIGINDTRE